MNDDDKPYEPFGREQLLLRDYLALDRTSMANERTVLAYIRTALAMLIVGGTMLHVFTDNLPLRLVAFAFIVLGVMTTVIGAIRFEKTRRSIKAAKSRPVSRGNFAPPP